MQCEAAGISAGVDICNPRPSADGQAQKTSGFQPRKSWRQQTACMGARAPFVPHNAGWMNSWCGLPQVRVPMSPPSITHSAAVSGPYAAEICTGDVPRAPQHKAPQHQLAAAEANIRKRADHQHNCRSQSCHMPLTCPQRCNSEHE